MLKMLRLMLLPPLAGITSFVATAGLYHTKFDSPRNIGPSLRIGAPGTAAKLFEAIVMCDGSLDRQVELQAINDADARDMIAKRLPTCEIQHLSSGLPVKFG